MDYQSDQKDFKEDESNVADQIDEDVVGISENQIVNHIDDS
jgi:hypothetical protein